MDEVRARVRVRAMVRVRVRAMIRVGVSQLFESGLLDEVSVYLLSGEWA